MNMTFEPSSGIIHEWRGYELSNIFFSQDIDYGKYLEFSIYFIRFINAINAICLLFTSQMLSTDDAG